MYTKFCGELVTYGSQLSHSITNLSNAMYHRNAPWIQGLKEKQKERDQLSRHKMVQSSSSAYFMVARETTILDRFENSAGKN